jgi:hypothetical protein
MRYTDEERQAALDVLAANEGDYQQTSQMTRITVATLKRWSQSHSPDGTELRLLRERFAAFRLQAKQLEDPFQQFAAELLAILMDDAIRLADSITEAINDAPLNQRSTALNQMMSNILKLLEILPPMGEQVTRVEFIDCDGTAHETPYWSRSDSDEQGAV